MNNILSTFVSAYHIIMLHCLELEMQGKRSIVVCTFLNNISDGLNRCSFIEANQCKHAKGY
jgi:hypothetical protein